MKKYLAIIGFLVFVAFGYVIATERTSTNTDKASWKSSTDATGLAIDSSGNLLPTGGDETLGSSTYPFRDVQARGISVSTFTCAYSIHETWHNLVLADSDSIKSMEISTATLTGTTTTWTETQGVTQWTSPRNISLTVWQKGIDGKDTLCVSTHNIVCNLYLTGYDAHGDLRYELITTTYCTQIKAGNVPFARVTTYTMSYAASHAHLISVADFASMRFGVGAGTKIGLTGDITATSDILKVNENGTGILYDNASITLSAAYDTIDFVTDPTSSATYEVFYRSQTNR